MTQIIALEFPTNQLKSSLYFKAICADCFTRGELPTFQVIPDKESAKRIRRLACKTVVYRDLGYDNDMHEAIDDAYEIIKERKDIYSLEFRELGEAWGTILAFDGALDQW